MGGIKVYLIYEGEPSGVDIVSCRKQREAHKLKITLPEKWLEGEVLKVLELFLNNYNKKFAADDSEKQLIVDEMTVRCGGVDVPVNGIVSNYIKEFNDVLIEHRIKPREAPKRPEGSVLCTNFGCGDYYLPDENTEDACAHHSGGPVFHDTLKYWSCCTHKKVMDWSDFEQIPPCATGPHCDRPRPTFQETETLSGALTPEQVQAMAQQQQPSVMMGETRQTTGPREFEGAKVGHEQPQQIVDGKASCRNFGCQKEFVVAENHDQACVHHSKGPVFWDTYKYWGCCPQTKKIEFDDFVAIPGCATGPHKL